MEWTGTQQLGLLLESGGLGVLIGLLFDGMGGIVRGGPRSRWRLFSADVIFGLLAALLTFFGSLAIMDGQMHPLLFGGCLLGFLAEHIGPGRGVGWLTCRLCREIRRLADWICVGLEALMGLIFGCIKRLFRPLKREKTCQTEENTEKSEKSRKKFRFFQKNS